MARLDPVIAAKALKAIGALGSEATVRGAYVFGSQVEDRADRWSDIDVAAFVDGVEHWDVERRAMASARAQRVAGDDVELHFFPAAHLEHPPLASFAAYVQKTGVILELSQARA